MATTTEGTCVSIFCTECGKPNVDEAKFCCSCGQALCPTPTQAPIVRSLMTGREPLTRKQIIGWSSVFVVPFLLVIIAGLCGAYDKPFEQSETKQQFVTRMSASGSAQELKVKWSVDRDGDLLLTCDNEMVCFQLAEYIQGLSTDADEHARGNELRSHLQGRGFKKISFVIDDGFQDTCFLTKACIPAVRQYKTITLE